MLPRWVAAIGFLGLCTSFACFPPMAVAPITQDRRPTSEPSRLLDSPSPSPTVRPTPSASGSPS